ncbi:hypothetical protein RG47T_4096 [Mucilaginibacter polytrichastri]|uniref:Uncharacterized protein n=1 Tax=Mucilaginibacter polytrichastri TaxID=1302689 RepID=A0A1Q6A3N7_9SPHI|nr:hypothetical protein RG47T_4096 [Mucilaginibacter polytrichastri]
MTRSTNFKMTTFSAYFQAFRKRKQIGEKGAVLLVYPL